jgi:geranylgeranyl diphosphate synthase, type II
MSRESAKVAYAKEALLIIQPYKERFETEMQKAFSTFGPDNSSRKAMEYALKGDGKRFRPALVYMVAEAIGAGIDVTSSCLAVEYFHTASLIADDLPSMDNDDFRRGIPTTHKVFGEASALLASYGLIALGFEEIARNAEALKDSSFEGTADTLVRIAVLEAARQMGNAGLIGGQCLDLYPESLTKEAILQIMEMKTVSLFDLSIVLGWLFGGGDQVKLPIVHKMALHFGLAFQIIDDLDDSQKDKEANRLVNYANLFGRDEAINAVKEHIEGFFSCMNELEISSEPLSKLAKGLSYFAGSF